MNKKLWTVAALASALAVAACQPVDKEEDSVADGSGDGGAVVPDVNGPNDQDGNNGIDDPADQGPGKSLKLEGAAVNVTSSDYNPHAWTLANGAVTITVAVSLAEGQVAPDGTVVTFLSMGGRVGEGEYIGNPVIEDGSPILGYDTCQIGEKVPGSGMCTTTFWTGEPLNITPGYMGRAGVIAIVEGNDFHSTKFIGQKYAKDAYFESFGDPLLDLDENGTQTDSRFVFRSGTQVIEMYETAYDGNASGVFETDYGHYYGYECVDENASPGCGQSAWMHDFVLLNQASMNFAFAGPTAVQVIDGSRFIQVELSSYETGNYPPSGTELAVKCGETELSLSEDSITPANAPGFEPWRPVASLPDEVVGLVTCTATATFEELTYEWSFEINS